MPERGHEEELFRNPADIPPQIHHKDEKKEYHKYVDDKEKDEKG